MKGLEIAVLAIGGVLGTFLRYKIIESPLLFGFLPVNILIVNVLGAIFAGRALMKGVISTELLCKKTVCYYMLY